MTELARNGGSTPGPSRAPDPARDRRVLVVTYFFPPLGGVGVQRTLKFVSNLRDLGWLSVVLVPADPEYPVRDPALLADVPDGVTVLRVRCPEPVALASRVARRIRPRSRGQAEGPSRAGTNLSAVASASSGPHGSGGTRAVGPSRRFLRMMAGAWVRAWRSVLFPDEQALWARLATSAGRRAHAREPVEAIYSSSPPVTVHVVARAIARATGRPWVADFRDPWIGNGFAAPVSDRRRLRMARLERALVADADRVVLASPTMARDFRARYPDLAERFVVIPNGYDRTELEGIEAVSRPAGTYTIVYAGSIYGDRELGLFLDGLERLVRRRPEARERLRVEFVGRINEPNRRLADSYATRERLGGVVSFLGFVPRREALARMRSADALLQIIADDPGKDAVIGGKVPEYLGFDLPILAVVPKGDARAILEELGWGIVADPEPEAVAGAIERLLDSPAPRGSADPKGTFDRRAQARRLAAILDEVVARR